LELERRSVCRCLRDQVRIPDRKQTSSGRKLLFSRFELGVDGILEGSVIRENDQVRVTVQLLDGPGPSSDMTEASVYYQLRDFPSLVEASQRGIASSPNEWVEHHNLGIGYEGTGKLMEAIPEYQKAVELSNGDQDANASLAHAYAVIGKRAEAEQILHNLLDRSKDNEVSPYILATIYAGLGEKDKAMQFLEKAYNERSLEISWHLKADLRIDSLRSDPRFQDLARRFGLPQ
jgi:tetratricopeptide (TPR) repeat protein